MRSRLLIAVSSALSIALLATASAQTQTWNGNKINGVPASVTSFGFGGHPGFHGVPASVTSLNFGAVPNANAWGRPHFGFGERRHHRNGNNVFVTPLYGAYYAPYGYPSYYVVDPSYEGSFQADDSQPVMQE